ncbi:unnamed protein product [Caenorhabditis bovis]|uniref:G-protein coupled receptors family 1 profile domain-containing protein n=1 Tax=Caenorhabditis bovis TaxID=2654633 RepID=A0A8S1F1N6_9PELO|nr:unnamed protein product [Caenorhabditis bovis]
MSLLLLMLIIFKSPQTLRIYSIFLINSTLGDLVFAFSTAMAQIRIIPNKWAFAYVSLGPGGWIAGSEGGYFFYCLMLHSLFYMFLCFPISFGFRYWILVRQMPNKSSCILFCFSLWLLALTQHVLFTLSRADSVEIRKYLKANQPQYDLDQFFVSGNFMINSPMTCIVLATIVLPMFPIYVLIIYFYKKVNFYLMSNIAQLSEETLRGHKKLIEVLSIQASLPLLFIFPPITLYGLYHLEIVNFQASEYLVYTIFSFLPITSPMISIIYIKPYNTAFRKTFCHYQVMPMLKKSVVTIYGEAQSTRHSSTRFD